MRSARIEGRKDPTTARDARTLRIRRTMTDSMRESAYNRRVDEGDELARRVKLELENIFGIDGKRCILRTKDDVPITIEQLSRRLSSVCVKKDVDETCDVLGKKTNLKVDDRGEDPEGERYDRRRTIKSVNADLDMIGKEAQRLL